MFLLYKLLECILYSCAWLFLFIKMLVHVLVFTYYPIRLIFDMFIQYRLQQLLSCFSLWISKSNVQHYFCSDDSDSQSYWPFGVSTYLRPLVGIVILLSFVASMINNLCLLDLSEECVKQIPAEFKNANLLVQVWAPQTGWPPRPTVTICYHVQR
jgi:hypothetical protein